MNLAFNNNNASDNIFIIKMTRNGKITYVMPNIPAITLDRALDQIRDQYIFTHPVRLKVGNGTVVSYNCIPSKVMEFVKSGKVPEGCVKVTFQKEEPYFEAAFNTLKAKSDKIFYSFK